MGDIARCGIDKESHFGLWWRVKHGRLRQNHRHTTADQRQPQPPQLLPSRRAGAVGHAVMVQPRQSAANAIIDMACGINAGAEDLS